MSVQKNATSFKATIVGNEPFTPAKHRVTIKVASVGASLSYSSVARIQADASRNSTDYPLLPGPMSVYLDNSFIVNSNLPAVSPEEPEEKSSITFHQGEHSGFTG